MAVRKISPAPRWRTFAKEVSIIVLGVVIALVGQQIVEAANWSQQVAEARAALSVEFSGDIALAEERARIAPCIARRIQDIAGILDTAGRTGQLPPVGQIGGPPDRTWTVASWSSTVASQTAAHLPQKQLLDYGSLATYGSLLQTYNADEVTTWAQLNAIVGPGRPIDLAEIGQLRASLSHAHLLAKQMTSDSEQFARWIRRSGVASRAIWPDDPDPKGAPPICVPLGRAPTTYGAAPLRYELPGWTP
jgi:hypothetical protein